MRASKELAPPVTTPLASATIRIPGAVCRTTFNTVGMVSPVGTTFTFHLVITPLVGAAVGSGLHGAEISNRPKLSSALFASQASPNSVAAEAAVGPTAASIASAAKARAKRFLIRLSQLRFLFLLGSHLIRQAGDWPGRNLAIPRHVVSNDV